MRLATLSARNLKGRSFSIMGLSPMTMFVGQNFAGKTARTDAIRLLLLGYLPELGKTARATFGLCSGKEMVIEGCFDNGERIFRRWYLKGDTVKTEEIIAPSLETAGDVVSVMLNAETYFGLSDRERINYVFAHIPNLDVKYDRRGIEQAILGDLFGTEGLNGKAVEEFAARWTTAEDPLGYNATPQEVLEWAVAWAAEDAKQMKVQAGTMEKTAQGLAYLRLQDTAKEDELPGLERQMAKLKEEIETLRDTNARRSAEMETAIKAKRRREELTRDPAITGRASLLSQQKMLTERIANLETTITGIGALTPDDHAALAKEEREAAMAVQRAAAELLQLEERASVLRSDLAGRERIIAQRLELQTKIDDLTRRSAAVVVLDPPALLELNVQDGGLIAAKARNESDLRQVDESLEKNRKDLENVDGQTRCAYCGASGDGWKTLKKAEIDSALAGLVAKRTQLRDHAKKLEDSARSVAEQLRTANENKAQRQEIDGLLRRLGDQMENLEALINASEGKAAELQMLTGSRSERVDAHIRAREIAERLASRLKRANDLGTHKHGKEAELRSAREALSAVDRLVAAGEAKAAELAAIPTVDIDLGRQAATVAEELEKKQRTLTDLETRRRSLVGRSQDLRRLSEAEQLRDNAKLGEEVSKTAAAALRELQRKFVEEAFRPLLETANAFFSEVLTTPLAYNDGEIGTWREGTWVGHKTFSGAEKRLAYVAIQAALASRSPFRLMLLDELGTVDDVNAMKVARGVAAAIERGAIDQFVGIDVGRGLLYSAEAEFGSVPLTVEAISETS